MQKRSCLKNDRPGFGVESAGVRDSLGFVRVLGSSGGGKVLRRNVSFESRKGMCVRPVCASAWMQWPAGTVEVQGKGLGCMRLSGYRIYQGLGVVRL